MIHRASPLRLLAFVCLYKHKQNGTSKGLQLINLLTQNTLTERILTWPVLRNGYLKVCLKSVDFVCQFSLCCHIAFPHHLGNDKVVLFEEENL